jgi:hypothetical protein
MFALQTIIDCLLAGASRISADQRADVLCTMFAALLPQMTDTDVVMAREQVVSRLWPSVELAEPLLNLIDGHVELRMLLHTLTNEDLAENYGDSGD